MPFPTYAELDAMTDQELNDFIDAVAEACAANMADAAARAAWHLLNAYMVQHLSRAIAA